MMSWNLSVTLRSPFLIPGSGLTAALADAVAARTPDNKHALIPYSLMLGLLRDAVTTAHSVDPKGFQEAAEAFGPPLTVRTGPDLSLETDPRAALPQRRTLILSDLVADIEIPPHLYHRIQIDAQRGSVRETALYILELVAPLGQEVRFTGTLSCTSSNAKTIMEQITKALPLIRAIGSHKSSGFGEVVAITTQEKEQPPPAALPATAAPPLPFLISLTLDRPFLIDAKRPTDNQYRGATVIPGAALKGVLAETLGAVNDPDLSCFLTRLTLGHAFPQPESQPLSAFQPPVVPLSLAVCNKGGNSQETAKVLNLLWEDDPTIPVRQGDGVPVLETDWKDNDRNKALEVLGLSSPCLNYDIRVRTAVDNATGTPRYDRDSGTGALFSHAAVIPDQHHWVSRWSLPTTPSDSDQRLLQRLLEALRQGAPGLGKTRATLTAQEIIAAPQDTPSPVHLPKHGPCWVLTLLTDAVLGLGTREDYAAYWQGLGFTLIRHFAAQRLAGGYHALRYPIDRTQGYRPYVLTRPGSTFLLTGGTAEAVADLCHNGLPPAAPFTHRSWQEFPFGRENGFGAISAKRFLKPTEARHG